MANTHSADFDGVDQSLSRADDGGLDWDSDFTFEAWVYLDATPASGEYYDFIDKQSGGEEGGYWWYYENQGGTPYIVLMVNDGTGNGSTKYAYTIATETWVHIAVVADLSAQTFELFINGSSEGTSNTNLKTSIGNDSGAFTIGGPNDYMTGRMDDIRIWTDKRTSGEISANYQKELVGNEAGLLAYWKLNNSLLDETANDNDLTNNNGVTFPTDPAFVEAAGPATLKTRDTVVAASIKTIDGVAIASVKTIDTAA